MRVRLSPQLFEYALQGNFLGERERALLMNASRSDQSYVVDLSDDDADAIRDASGEHLQRVGFDGDYRPTLEGRMLEELVDLLQVRQPE
jgi:hypothetical protein